MPLGALHPLSLIADDTAVPALQLDDEQARTSEHEDIHLVEAALTVGESDIRPGSGDPVIGEQLADLVQRLGFLRLGGIAHHPPQRRISPHLRSTPRQQLLHNIRAMRHRPPETVSGDVIAHSRSWGLGQNGRMVTVTAVHGDITEQAVDVIVNAANRHMRGGGGVDGAIHRAGGRAILDDCIARFPDGLRTGAAGWTTAGQLHARWVIHAVGPNYAAGEKDRSLLESCYRQSLAIADELGARSVAFPLISAGAYGWPLNEAIDVALDTIARSRTHVDDVRLVSFDESTHRRVRAQALRQFPPPTDSRSVGHLFDRAPYRWHFRGDPYLWRSLRADLASVPLPTDVWTLERMIRTAFESITGRPLTDNNEPFHVPEFDPGHGMSAGGVTPAWWVSTAIPILIDRFEATLPHEPDGDGLNVPSPAEQPGQED